MLSSFKTFRKASLLIHATGFQFPSLKHKNSEYLPKAMQTGLRQIFKKSNKNQQGRQQGTCGREHHPCSPPLSGHFVFLLLTKDNYTFLCSFWVPSFKHTRCMDAKHF